MKHSLVFVACLLATLLAHGQTSLDTLRHFDVQPLGSYSAIWGYTAPDGREYALVGVNGRSNPPAYPGGTSIIDITDPGNVYQAAFISGPNSGWREMKTYKHYAYVVSEGGGGVQIINLSQLPDTAWLVRSFVYTSGSNSTIASHSVSLHDGFLYLNGCSGWSPGGVVMFDLRNDPENPQYAGQYQPEYIHDCYVLRDTIYAAAIYGTGLIIADIRNKANPVHIATITYAGAGTHNAWVTKTRSHAITTDEIGSTAKNLKFWDIGNLPTISNTPAATFTPTPSDIVHNVTIRGDYAYVAWYTAGVRVVNIANPIAPSNAGGYDTSPSATGGYSGVWGVYPYFPSGKVIGGDMQNGLWVFSFSDLAPRQPVTLLEPVDMDSVDGQAPMTFRWTRTANMQKDPHYYEVRLYGAGFDSIWRSADTVTAFADFSSLTGGQTYSWYVITRDEFNEIPSPDTLRFVYAPSTLDVEGPTGTPKSFALGQNYPNPFNPSTSITVELPSAAHVSLEAYNLLGQRVLTLLDEVKPAGRHSVVVNASGLPSGVYFYRMRAGAFSATRKMVIQK